MKKLILVLGISILLSMWGHGNAQNAPEDSIFYFNDVVVTTTIVDTVTLEVIKLDITDGRAAVITDHSQNIDQSMLNLAIDQFIAKKALQAGYTRSVVRDSLMRDIIAGNPEALDFASKYLNGK